jgi:hypothetical protein
MSAMAGISASVRGMSLSDAAAREPAPPLPVAFAAQQQHLAAKPGAPIDDAQRNQLKPAATPAPAATVVTTAQAPAPTAPPPATPPAAESPDARKADAAKADAARAGAGKGEAEEADTAKAAARADIIRRSSLCPNGAAPKS